MKEDERKESGEEDREFLDLLRRDQTKALALLVERYAPMLYRYVRRMCGNETDAEDVLQETFLTAQEKISQFRGEGKIRNWLFRIAGNTCRQRFRQLHDHGGPELRLEDVVPEMEEEAVETTAPQLNPAELLLSAELREKLEAAIAEVPLTNRSVLILRDLEGLSTRETAAFLDISEQAVKVRLHRARAFVRKRLKDYLRGKE